LSAEEERKILEKLPNNIQDNIKMEANIYVLKFCADIFG
jgi:hypothetical protein